MERALYGIIFVHEKIYVLSPIIWVSKARISNNYHGEAQERNAKNPTFSV